MIEREMASVLRQRATEFPVVTIAGPRQSGKTTLARSCFPDYAYANLEDPETRDLAESDYRRFLAMYPAPAIIDEIQNVPKLASAIQVLVDKERGKCGQYVLTGSHQPLLKQSVTQSLAGRNALLTLLPLSFAELKSASKPVDLSQDALMLRGCMPELVSSKVDASVYYRNYVQTYLERDVKTVSGIKNSSTFRRFMTLLAGRVGQLLNLNSLSGEVGASHTTLSGWLDALEASFIVFRLQPYYANIGKRLVKTPKVYFSETALAASLLGIKTKEQMSRDPLRGQLFENLVVGEFVKQAFNSDFGGDLFFYRTANGDEVDIVRRTEKGLQPVEIKSAATWSRSLADGIRRFCKAVGGTVAPAVVYGGISYPPGDDGIAACNYLDATHERAEHR